MSDVGSPPAPTPAPPPQPGSRHVPVVAVWVRDLLVSLAISAFIIIFLYQPVKVEGVSMMPGLEDQERNRRRAIAGPRVADALCEAPRLSGTE